MRLGAVGCSWVLPVLTLGQVALRAGWAAEPSAKESWKGGVLHHTSNCSLVTANFATGATGRKAGEQSVGDLCALCRCMCCAVLRLTKELLDQRGLGLQEAVGRLRRVLPPSAILVGQNIAKDVEWLGLK